MTDDHLYWRWHVDVADSRAARLRLIDALLEHGCRLVAGRGSVLGHGRSTLLVVDVPRGAEIAFFASCRPLNMSAPPRRLRQRLGTLDEVPRDNYRYGADHPGRQDGWVRAYRWTRGK